MPSAKGIIVNLLRATANQLHDAQIGRICGHCLSHSSFSGLFKTGTSVTQCLHEAYIRG